MDGQGDGEQISEHCSSDDAVVQRWILNDQELHIDGFSGFLFAKGDD
jgi:hypothetical protein